MGAKITLLSVIDINVGAFLAQTIAAVNSPTHLIETIEDYLKQIAGAYIKEGERICKKKWCSIKKGHQVRAPGGRNYQRGS